MSGRAIKAAKHDRHFKPNGNRSFEFITINKCNWWVRRSDKNTNLMNLIKDPDIALCGKSLLKDGSSNTVGEKGEHVIKRYNLKKIINLFKDIFRSTKAKRAFQLGYHLELVGVATPRVIALAENRVFGFVLRSYLVVEKIEGATDLSNTNYDSPEFIRRLAKLIGRMHIEGFTHRDLKTSNVLIDSSGKPYLIDLDGASFIGKVPARVAVSNLKRLERGLRGKSISSKSNRICFFRHYCYESGFHPSELKKSE